MKRKASHENATLCRKHDGVRWIIKLELNSALSPTISHTARLQISSQSHFSGAKPKHKLNFANILSSNRMKSYILHYSRDSRYGSRLSVWLTDTSISTHAFNGMSNVVSFSSSPSRKHNCVLIVTKNSLWIFELRKISMLFLISRWAAGARDKTRG